VNDSILSNLYAAERFLRQARYKSLSLNYISSEIDSILKRVEDLSDLMEAGAEWHNDD
jgi:hypothetical protein